MVSVPTADHWCDVPDISSRGNLSLDEMKALTLPRVYLGEGREDIVIYQRCHQFNVNFSELYESNGGEWPDAPNPEWPVTKCQNGWVYDRSEYKNTLVTDVSDKERKNVKRHVNKQGGNRTENTWHKR
jgi:hypothetical protein